MKKYIALAFLAAILTGGNAFAAIKVVTTTQDLESITHEVGGDKVTVESLAKGYQDPHFVEAKPGFILKLHAADLLIAVGRELEIGWLPPLVNQARNLPTGQITRAMGDVHPAGNPHYWLGPDNGRRIAQEIQKKLSEISPSDASYFAQRYADFDRRLSEAEKRWQAALAPYKGVKVVTYHRSWPNFTDTFGLNVVGYVEPKPGIPPSPSHTLKRDRARDRRAGHRAGAVGRRREGGDRLLQAVRLRRQSRGERDQADGSEVVPWT